MRKNGAIHHFVKRTLSREEGEKPPSRRKGLIIESRKGRKGLSGGKGRISYVEKDTREKDQRLLQDGRWQERIGL